MAEKSVTQLDVHLTETTYPIYIGSGILSDVGRYAAQGLPATKICIVSDDIVASLYIESVTGALQKFGHTTVKPYIFPAGEHEKSLTRWESLVSHILDQGLKRNAIILALGGGVVGDLAGFAASAVMRGIPIVQVPTTLLAQVDSSVGGKTGVNTQHGKNMVGAFYHPAAVVMDMDVLQTLPKRHWRAGYAEIMKYGLINDPDFFEWLDGHVDDLMAGDKQALEKAIKVSCQAKIDIVRADEKETGDRRALLNLGHTFGHALETIGGYDGRLLHGEAVGIGILMAARFSVSLGICDAEDATRIEAHLQKAGLPTYPPFAFTADNMLDIMWMDKKASDHQMNLILMRGIGKAFIDRTVPHDVLHSFLKTQEGYS